MTPDDTLRAALREAIDEEIPDASPDTATRFTDVQIDALLTVADSLAAAAVAGWEFKASRAYSEAGGVAELTIAGLRIKGMDVKAYRDHCLAMAALWQTKVDALATGLDLVGSRLFGVAQPDVLGTGQVVESDLSRLSVLVEW